ncbi:hypothetical protein F2Q70_00031158 [Brassica cretica]|uniref:Uncharacterized protein n=1 Tax=Brassica cretica TaxID=69181 RepID=A0A8S9FDL7_BRACR|nr:hypothetical protein F2Q70_00031158 [Brassica cretica]
MRGYAFTRKGHSRTTYDDGVSSCSGDDVYYGNIEEILEIQFPGMVGLRWFHQFAVTRQFAQEFTWESGLTETVRMRQKMSFNNSDITDLLHGFLVM